MRVSKRPKRATIIPNQVFLDEGQRFEKDVEYRVDIEKARYFFRNGWLVGSENPNPTPDPAPVELDIHKSWLKSIFRSN